MIARIATVLALTICLTATAQDGEKATAELTAYVENFLTPVKQMRNFEQRRQQALGMVPIIVKYSELYDIDPLLVAVIISFESSWRPKAIGRRGEVGVMQVMPRFFTTYDLNTTDGQIHAGVEHLRVSIGMCGPLDEAINYYGSNQCRPVGKWVGYRLRAYECAKRRFRI